MPYIGKEAAAGQTETVKDSFNGDNSTTAFTMSQSVGLDTDIEVFVGNVQQEPGSGKAYTVSGTTLTFSEAPPTGTGNIYVIHRNSLQGTLLPPQNLGDRNYLIGGDLSLDADGAALKFGVDSEITLTHSADSGLLLKHANTADDSAPVLTLQTGDTDIAQNDVLGSIKFQAPDEAAGTDAILVAASIDAVSEGDFSSSSNATKLVFKTGASEVASEKMSLSSAGLLTIADDLMIKDGGTIGVASTNDAITISSAGIVTFKDDIIIKDAGTIGSASDTDAISISSGGVVNISATTANTSASDGALTVAGGLGVALDASIGDDLRLISDSAVLNFGADNDVTLTHVADVGITLSGRLGVNGGGAGDASTSLGAFDLVLGSTSSVDNGMTILSTNAAGKAGRIHFADGTSGASLYAGFIMYAHDTDIMSLGTAGTTRFRINATGFVKAQGNSSNPSNTSDNHDFSDSSTDQAIMRVSNSNSSYASNGFETGCLRTSSTAYNMIVAHHGNGSTTRFDDRTFKVDGTGAVHSDSSTSIGSGADYAEFFEWEDGNSSSEDRIGQSVVLDGNKIRKATSSDSASNIIGVISGNPSVVGDSAELRWQGKWELDAFNRRQTEEVEVYEWTDEHGEFYSFEPDKVPEGLTVPSDRKVVKIENDKYSSSYDRSKKDGYVPRKDRKEWDMVGMMGKLRMLKGQPTGDRWIKMRDISDTVEEWLVR